MPAAPPSFTTGLRGSTCWPVSAADFQPAPPAPARFGARCTMIARAHRAFKPQTCGAAVDPRVDRLEVVDGEANRGNALGSASLTIRPVISCASRNGMFAFVTATGDVGGRFEKTHRRRGAIFSWVTVSTPAHAVIAASVQRQGVERSNANSLPPACPWNRRAGRPFITTSSEGERADEAGRPWRGQSARRSVALCGMMIRRDRRNFVAQPHELNCGRHQITSSSAKPRQMHGEVAPAV